MNLGSMATFGSSFDEWKRNNGVADSSGVCRTTWPQQLALAKQLYDQAYQSEPRFTPYDSKSAEDVIQDLQNAKYDADEIVSWKGISADWLLDVFCQTPFVQRLIAFDCDCWFVREVCLIEFLRRKGERGALVDHAELLTMNEITGGSWRQKRRKIDTAKTYVRRSTIVREKADVFISYTGRYKFRFFVERLVEMRGQYLWMDLFCVDQFAWSGGKGTQALNTCRDALLGGLRNRIQEIGSVMLLLERWDGVVDTVGQSWVFWEMFNAARADADIQLVLTLKERTRLLASLDSVEETVWSQIMAMDMDKLQAANLSDKTAICKRLESEKVSLRDVSCTICDCIRDLFCNEVTRYSSQLCIGGSFSSVHRGIGTYFQISHMACFLKSQGKLKEAELLYQEASDGKRRILGNDHPTTLSSINDMATCLHSKGRLDIAELLYREALDGNRRILGNDHRDTLTSINNMASVLEGQGRLEEAEPLYRDTLDGRRRILGNDHPDTLTSINNMAGCLHSQGKLEEAELLYREALDGCRHILGNDHRDTLTCINNMEGYLQSKGRLEEAEPLYREALDGRRSILGNDHPRALTSINNMSYCLNGRGRLEDAEPFCREALDGFRRILGNNHPGTLTFINNMAAFLQNKGRLEEAEPLLREALAGCRRILGNDHPDTLTSISDMADCLKAQGSPEEAKRLHREALDGRRRILGNDHPDTLTSIKNMMTFETVPQAIW